MILSVSRRTDIPAFYSEWFWNRLREGFVWVRNPMNPKQISQVSLRPEVVDGLVFWTKNPAPLISKLERIKAFPYYFQFTLNPYNLEIEANVPPETERITTFQALASQIGPERVIWRYDPIFLTDKITPEFHFAQFTRLAEQLCQSTSKCIISFLTFYQKTVRNMKGVDPKIITSVEKAFIAEEFARIAGDFGLSLEICAADFQPLPANVKKAHCIDKEFFERMLGARLGLLKDSGQRSECGCAASIDIGGYNTCRHGCKYCYANYDELIVKHNQIQHDPKSALIIGEVRPGEKVTERKVKSGII